MPTAAITSAPCAKCPFRRDVPIYLRNCADPDGNCDTCSDYDEDND